MAKNLLNLQNGSDIRGIAQDGIPSEKVNLTPEIASNIGAAFAKWLAKNTGKNESTLKVCIGMDPRKTGKELAYALSSGLCSLDVTIGSAGLASTPAMFMSCIDERFNFDGAIMVTASHLPWNRNGFKFFTAKGGLNKEDISNILVIAGELNIPYKKPDVKSIPLMDAYTAHLRNLISDGIKEYNLDNLSGLHVVVDAGNGAGGFFATKVLEPLGADISGSQFLDPDGSFPNHVPNPENKDAMASVCAAATAAHADLGLIFDTDVDRSAAVSGSGEPVRRNGIVALAAALGCAKHPGGTVVTDSITSNELHTFLEEQLGLKHLRYKRGYRNVINKAIEMTGEDAFLAIETSGHAAYADNRYLDDGAYLACLIVIAAAGLKKEGKDILRLISELKEPVESEEIRFKINEERVADDPVTDVKEITGFADYADIILDSMHYWAEETDGLEIVTPNYEGIRVNFNLSVSENNTMAEGWFLLRKSLHDPVMPLNIESDTYGGVEMVSHLIKEFLSQFEGIEI